MQWLGFRIQMSAEAVDIVVSTLYEAGFEGALIEDKQPLSAWEKEQMFVDISLPEEEDDGIAYVSFFLEKGEQGLLLAGDWVDAGEARRRLEEELDFLSQFGDLGELSIEERWTEDLDWVNNWKQYFHAFWVDDVYIVPSWEEPGPLRENSLLLRIDPGTAFGTGMHETTRLCIRALESLDLRGARLLDLGTGSGILSILAVKRGAERAVATDLDPCAQDALEYNCRENQIEPGGIELHLADLAQAPELAESLGRGSFTVVVANILAPVLQYLMGTAASMLAPGGYYICSGILAGQEAGVLEAMAREGIECLRQERDGEWIGLVGRKV